MKVALLNDYFVAKGGEERQVLLLAKQYNADIYTYFATQQTFEDLFRFNIFSAKNPIKIPSLRALGAIKHFKKLKIEGDYDAFIINGYHTIFAGQNNHPNLWFSFGPPDPMLKIGETNIRSKIHGALRRTMSASNKHAVREGIDILGAVCRYTANNIQKFYGRAANIIPPPVELKRFRFKEVGDFYLSVSRLEPIKRVDMIVEAFKRMPDKKIVVAGGGSQLQHLRNLAKGHDNIKIMGQVSDEILEDLIGRCIAFICIPSFDQLPSTPMQAMAAGKPIIVSDEGGLPELVGNEKVGLVIKASVPNLVSAVKATTPQISKSLKDKCVKRSKNWDVKNTKKIIDNLLRDFIKNRD